MRQAVALGGGGARGSYEVGVWKAMREEGIDCDIVTGTSIGAINGALMVQGDFDRAYELWKNISVGDVMADGFDMGLSVEVMEAAIRQPTKVGAFLKKYARHKGADISPLVGLLGDVIDEGRMRRARTEFGLVTVALPKMAVEQLTLAEIPEGMLTDYLLASAACFPAFPVYRIGDRGYIDGGYGDNLPISLAFAMGAERVIAVDLEYARPTHPKYTAHPLVTYVRPTRPICSMLNFRTEAMEFNLRLGYLDAKKALGALRGFTYAFADAQHGTEARAEAFARMLTVWDARADQSGGPVRIAREGLLTDCVRRDTRGARLSALDCFLRAGEIAASLAGLEPLEVYTPDGMAALLGRYFAEQTGSKVSELMYLVEQGERGAQRTLRAAQLHPREFCAALYLHCALGGEKLRAAGELPLEGKGEL